MTHLYKPGAVVPVDVQTTAKLFNDVMALRDGLQSAIWRIEDMLKGDDGQAWKEAEKSLPRLKNLLGE